MMLQRISESEAERVDLDEPTFARRPRRLQPIIDEPCSAVLDVHFRDDGQRVPQNHTYRPQASVRPRWTTSPPTSEGFWFVRAQGTHSATVVRVFRHTNGELLFGWSDLPARPVTVAGLEWGSAPMMLPDDLGDSA